MAKKRLNIRRSIERLLIPVLEARGFVRQPPVELHTLFPYGELRRSVPYGVDIVEIQFDKNNSSHFRLNLELETPQQIRESHGAYVTRWGLPLRRWFGVRKRMKQGITEAEFDAAVELAVRRLTEIDRYFSTGRTSWRISKIPEPGWVTLLLLVFWLAVTAAVCFGALLAWTVLVKLVLHLFMG